MVASALAYNTMKLALRLAVLGFLIEVCFLSFWLLEDRFNFFHLPTVEEVAKMPGNYSEPPLRSWLEKTNFVLCPPLVITVFGMDLGQTANFVLVSIAAVTNAVLYFLVGLAAIGIRNKVRGERARSPSDA